MKYIGIDPGLSGAIAVIHETGIISFFDTPTVQVKSGKKTRNIMDTHEIVNLMMMHFGRSAEVCAVLEKVSAAPIEGRTQGTVSMFNFGMGYGIWQGILAGLQMPFTLVHPATWKAKLMRDMGKGKDASIVRAKQLYPESAPQLSRKKDHGRADALLLAHYARVFLVAAPEAPPQDFKLTAKAGR